MYCIRIEPCRYIWHRKQIWKLRLDLLYMYIYNFAKKRWGWGVKTPPPVPTPMIGSYTYSAKISLYYMCYIAKVTYLFTKYFRSPPPRKLHALFAKVPCNAKDTRLFFLKEHWAFLRYMYIYGEVTGLFANFHHFIAIKINNIGFLVTHYTV